jgi:urease beta subunit
MRLDIAAGTAVRFEPGQTATLVALAGKRVDLRFPRRRDGEAVSGKRELRHLRLARGA